MKGSKYGESQCYNPPKRRWPVLDARSNEVFARVVASYKFSGKCEKVSAFFFFQKRKQTFRYTDN